MTYILLSAGIGRSIKTKGSQALITYNHSTVLEHQIKTIRSVDKDADIIVVIGFQHKKILKKFIDSDVRFVVNEKYDETNQSYSLMLGINCSIESELKIIHGDIVFSKNAIFGKGNHVVQYNTKNPDKRKVGLCHNGTKVTNLSYGLDDKWGQIFGIAKESYGDFKKIVNASHPNRCTFEIINMMINKVEMKLFCTDSRIIEIDKRYEDTDNF